MKTQKKPELTALLDGTREDEKKNERTVCGINEIIDVLSAWTCNFSLVSQQIETLTKCRKASSISRTKSQSLNVSCIVLQLSSLNPLKPCVNLRMEM